MIIKRILAAQVGNNEYNPLASFDYSEVSEYIKNYLPEHEGESEFLDSYCYARKELTEAINRPEEEKDLALSDLNKALENVEKSCNNSTDPFSHWVNAPGLKEIITNAIQKISGLK